MAHEQADHVCPPWLGYFLLANPLRRLLYTAKSILEPYLSDGMTVLEPGPAMGFFTLEAARLVGPKGRVVAVDIESKCWRSFGAALRVPVSSNAWKQGSSRITTCASKTSRGKWISSWLSQWSTGFLALISSFQRPPRHSSPVGECCFQSRRDMFPRSTSPIRLPWLRRHGFRPRASL